MAKAERHAELDELDPTGHWLQEEGAVCGHFEELLSGELTPDELTRETTKSEGTLANVRFTFAPNAIPRSRCRSRYRR
jgi:hypothetical protein